jgi:glucose-6-phosphate isomerase
MAEEAEWRLRAAGIAEPWSRFVAITDEGTALHTRAITSGFRETFLNPADIGGRYSALSFFGLVPAALMGIDVDALVLSARPMASACRETDPRHNPGLALGALMAAGARSGRDKLTIILPPRLRRFGLWVEQLIAESTGKQGQGVVPVTGEAGDEPVGDDRVVVAFDITREWGETPRMMLETARPGSLGCEFFRWEVATAAAGYLLGINPFDEPNVQQAKEATRALLDTYAAQGRLPTAETDAAIDRVRLTLSRAARSATQDPRSFLTLVRPSDYVALLAFLPEDATFAPVLDAIRHDLALKTGCVATLGYGPRYLHSTGQLH